MFVHFVLVRIYLQALIVMVSDCSEPRVSQWIRSNRNPLSWFKWGSYASNFFICFPKLVKIALVARAAGSPRLIAPIRFGMSRLFLGMRMRAQPRSMRTLLRHAIKEHRHMPSRYPEPDWQTFCTQPHCAGANNSVSVSHQHMSKYHHTYSIWKALPIIDKLSD